MTLHAENIKIISESFTLLFWKPDIMSCYILLNYLSVSFFKDWFHKRKIINTLTWVSGQSEDKYREESCKKCVW